MKKYLLIIIVLVAVLTLGLFVFGDSDIPLLDKFNQSKEEDTSVSNYVPEIRTEPYQEKTTQGEPLQKEPIPEETYSRNPVIDSATTISGKVLESSNVNSARSFGAKKAIDGYYDSCWCVNANTGGAGAKIRFNLREKSLVKGFLMVNGNLYQPEKDIFKSNGQVKNFTLTFSDGTSKTFTAYYNDSASANFEDFLFDTPVITDYIVLTVNSGYVGQKYTENVAIGEVRVY